MTDFDPSPLDRALMRHAADPDDSAARLALHAELAQAELVVWLDGPAAPGRIRPRVFDLDQRTVLAFATEGRLAEFAGAGADYAALPGRVLAALLAGQGLALLIDADGPAPALLPGEALGWLADTLSDTRGAPAAQARLALPVQVAPPETAPDLDPDTLAALVAVLERRLSGVPGLSGAVLAAAVWQDGSRGLVLALAGVPESGHAPLVRAVTEALSLSDMGAVALDVLFPDAGGLDRLRAQGRALAPAPWTAPEEPLPPGSNPGLDPSRPPRLR